MRTLEIEFKHIEGAWNGCMRCGSTGEALTGLVGELARDLGRRGVEVRYRETVVPGERLAESNQVLFNGKPAEELLGATIGSSPCGCGGACAVDGGCGCGCTDPNGTVECRTLIIGGTVHEALSRDLLREAAMRAIGDA